MSRYIDAEQAIGYLLEHKRVGLEQNIVLRADEDSIIKFINTKCPTADVEEVVRCRDCIHCEAGAYTDLLYCEYFDWGIKADDFCSYGERKDEE